MYFFLVQLGRANLNENRNSVAFKFSNCVKWKWDLQKWGKNNKIIDFVGVICTQVLTAVLMAVGH